MRDLERRDGELEGSFQFLSTQLSGVHKSVLEIQSEVGELRSEMGDFRLEVNQRFDAIPEIVASAVAGALRS